MPPIAFDYQPLPTMRGFHASNARTRLIVGGY